MTKSVRLTQVRTCLPAVWAAGPPGRLRIHDLRHTCAALLISRGAHVKAVQHHLGHSSATVTLNTYSHLFPDAMERVVDGLEETYREAETACRRPELDARVLDQRSPGATHTPLTCTFAWRRARDSNPQVLSDNGFQDRPLAN